MDKKTHMVFGVVSILILLGLLLWGYLYPSSFFGPENLKATIIQFGVWAPLIFITVQILQVVITPISHYAVGIVGGYIFGFWWGTLLNWIGRVIGHLIAFYLSKTFGRPLARKIIGKENIKKYDRFWETGGGITLFLMYFLPLFPDDEISYIAGISNIKYKTFLRAAVLGHTGGAASLALFGAGIATNNTWLLIINGIVFFASLGLWFLRKRLKLVI